MADARPEMPRAVASASNWFVGLLAGSMLVSALPLPWALLSGLLAAAAFAFGIRTMIVMRNGATTGLWVLMSIGTFFAGSGAVSAAGAAVLYDAYVEYESCVSDAITYAAGRECDATFEDSRDARLAEVEAWLRGLLN